MPLAFLVKINSLTEALTGQRLCPLFQMEEDRKKTKKHQPVSETKKKPAWKDGLTKTLNRLGAKSKQEQVPNFLNA